MKFSRTELLHLHMQPNEQQNQLLNRAMGQNNSTSFFRLHNGLLIAKEAESSLCLWWKDVLFVSRGAAPSCSGGHFELPHALKNPSRWGMGDMLKLASGSFIEIGKTLSSLIILLFFSMIKEVTNVILYLIVKNYMIVIYNIIQIVCCGSG